VEVELAEDARHVGAGCVLADEERLRDLRVRLRVGDQLEYFQLERREFRRPAPVRVAGGVGRMLAVERQPKVILHPSRVRRVAQTTHRFRTGWDASVGVVATNPITYGERASFLLELLYFAGWQLQIRRGNPTTIRATRDDVSLEVAETSLLRAAGVMFARAMRSSHGDGYPKGK
jgi:hypothetical protein